MTEQEISVKLTETEQRAKSNTHRIEKLEQQQKDLNKLVTAVEVLASREKGVETAVKEIKADVKTIPQKGGKRWDAMIDRVLYVQECMRNHPGAHYEMVNKCSCALDRLASEVSFDDYMTMNTAFNANSIGGERGNTIRDAESLQVQIRRYRELQSRIQKSCFIEK